MTILKSALGLAVATTIAMAFTAPALARDGSSHDSGGHDGGHSQAMLMLSKAVLQSDPRESRNEQNHGSNGNGHDGGHGDGHDGGHGGGHDDDDDDDGMSP